MSDRSRPRFVSLRLDEIEVPCTNLEVERRGSGSGHYLMRLWGTSWPRQLRETFGMGSSIAITRDEGGVLKTDFFIAQDALASTEEMDGAWRLEVEVILAKTWGGGEDS